MVVRTTPWISGIYEPEVVLGLAVNAEIRLTAAMLHLVAGRYGTAMRRSSARVFARSLCCLHLASALAETVATTIEFSVVKVKRQSLQQF